MNFSPSGLLQVAPDYGAAAIEGAFGNVNPGAALIGPTGQFGGPMSVRGLVAGDLPNLAGSYLSLSAGGTVTGFTVFQAQVVVSPPNTGNPCLLLVAPTTSTEILQEQASGDTQPRFQIRGDGRLEFGPGNAATDFFIARNGLAAGQLNFAGSGGANITFNLNGAVPNLDLHMATGGVDAGIRMFNSSGTLIAQIDGNTAALYLETITALPIRFVTNNVVQWVLGSGGSLVTNLAALANNATTGFMGLPSVAGTPTGVPTNPGGGAPVYTVFDTTAGKLWAYFGGAWKSVTFA